MVWRIVVSTSRPIKPIKPKKCRACRVVFTPVRQRQVVCGYKCALKLNILKIAKAVEVKKKANRAELKAFKIKIKTITAYLKDLEIVFNAWVRERDRDLPCISCGQHREVYHAGHYRTKVVSALRFNPLNVWKQCHQCNTYLRANLIEYRKALVWLLGVDIVEWLDGHHQSKKWTIEEIQIEIAKYKGRLDELRHLN